jgi:peptidoglycan L-alanyl-D-glutamate endopeptidase CwlK
MSSRAIKDMHSDLQVKYLAWAGLMGQDGIPFMLTCTYRSQDEQDELWRKGRDTEDNIIDKSKVVTWTKVSKHTSRRAFDFAVVKDGKPTWDLKVNVNKNDQPDYIEAGKLAEKVGLRAGYRFGDYCHIELKGDE